jgi:hypothetical protein
MLAYRQDENSLYLAIDFKELEILRKKENCKDYINSYIRKLGYVEFFYYFETNIRIYNKIGNTEEKLIKDIELLNYQHKIVKKVFGGRDGL